MTWSLRLRRQARQLRRAGKRDDEIGALIGRSAREVANELRLPQWEPPTKPALRVVRVDRRAEWLHRLALRPRDLTAAICGDPLPGYSALDRREAPE
jgi:hypothetical protein